MSPAAPLIDEPVGELKLADGRILRDARAGSCGEKSVYVKHRDGISAVPYDQFPAELRQVLDAKRPPPKSPEQIAAERAEADRREKETNHRLALLERRKNQALQRQQLSGLIKNGLRLLETHESQQREVVTFRVFNDTAQAQTISAGEILGTDSFGRMTGGLYLWVKGERQQRVEVAGNSSVDLSVSFFLPADTGARVESIRWMMN